MVYLNIIPHDFHDSSSCTHLMLFVFLIIIVVVSGTCGHKPNCGSVEYDCLDPDSNCGEYMDTPSLR